LTNIEDAIVPLCLFSLTRAALSHDQDPHGS